MYNFHVWGYLAEVKIYNLQIKKINHGSTSFYLWIIQIDLRVTDFMFFSSIKIVEPINSNFFKNSDFSGSDKVIYLVFEKELHIVTISITMNRIDEGFIEKKYY